MYSPLAALTLEALEAGRSPRTSGLPLFLGEVYLSQRNPAFQFYPADWRSDPVFTCSLAARGLWHEMMCMMHVNPRYGYLSQGDRPIADEQVARFCGCSIGEYRKLLKELNCAGVPRTTPEGIIYSKRMVSDEIKRNEWRNRQKKHRDTILEARDVTQMSRSSHAALLSSSSSSIQNQHLPPAPEPCADDGSSHFELWQQREAMRIQKEALKKASKSKWQKPQRENRNGPANQPASVDSKDSNALRMLQNLSARRRSS